MKEKWLQRGKEKIKSKENIYRKERKKERLEEKWLQRKKKRKKKRKKEMVIRKKKKQWKKERKVTSKKERKKWQSGKYKTVDERKKNDHKERKKERKKERNGYQKKERKKERTLGTKINTKIEPLFLEQSKNKKWNPLESQERWRWRITKEILKKHFKKSSSDQLSVEHCKLFSNHFVSVMSFFLKTPVCRDDLDLLPRPM